METAHRARARATCRRELEPSNDRLPNEILGLVFGRLECVDRRVRAAAVCRTWRLVALDDAAVGRHSCIRKEPSCSKTAAFHAAKSAAKAGHVDCARRIFGPHPAIDDPFDEIPRAAARSDDVDHFAWIVGQCRTDMRCVITDAASYGASRVLAHILLNEGSWLRSHHAFRGMKKAIKNGHVDCVRMLAPYCRGRDDPIAAVVARGTPAMVGLLVDAGHRLHEGACATAASWGRLDMLCYLRSIGCPWNAVTCAWAIKSRRLDILAYARNNGCPWDAQSCAAAVTTGQHQLLDQLRSVDCPWDATVCAAAAERGDLDALVRLHQAGCPMDSAVRARRRQWPP
ncbi:F-box domain containing protein [Pandoravirus salinus]|uniref:F-box domain containing protein n=1 Tax=Pandoravirus salinus TaxID=1349410 RepID=S4W297_9VIRU|nr:F-box domain [Pandoravirus salinus]AGO84572.1 F-box domain containing protein [Pandoravirus salinus]